MVKVPLFVSGMALFLLFILFSYLVHKNIFTQLDFNSTVRLQDKIPRRLDDAFSLFSDVGKFEVMSIVLGIICLYLALSKRIIAGVTAGVLYIGFHMIEIYGKFFVDHPPPPQFLLRTKHMIDFPQFHVRSEFSYPSGHSGRTLFIATIVAMLIWRSKLPVWGKAGIIGVIGGYTTIMVISRVYLGEHWATDVIGGGMLGAAFGIIVTAFSLKKTTAK
jgi:undecaprenyl-diphosphatase